MGPSNKTRFKEKRGQGHGKLYIPWIKVGEFSSNGQSSRVLGLKTGREHHFHSNFEASIFYIFDLQSEVKDIREQYPLLDLDLAHSIASQLGIKYPNQVEDHVLTSDYCFSYKDETELVVTMKLMKDISERQLELFEIERQYWLEKGVAWKLVTENEMPSRECLLNYKDIHNALKGFVLGIPQDEVIQHMYNHILEQHDAYLDFSLSEFSKCMDKELEKSKGTILRFIKSLIAKGIIKTDLNQPLVKGNKLIKDFNFKVNESTNISKSDLAA